eukprot:594087-Alexandrium_andersonii.AAC.1
MFISILPRGAFVDPQLKRSSASIDSRSCDNKSHEAWTAALRAALSSFEQLNAAEYSCSQP